MWYFSWILGTGLACFFAILNAVWLELRIDASEKADSDKGGPIVDPDKTDPKFGEPLSKEHD
tara:strand:- start:115 stop:300 length:186 start_codon:yes stop_codon:yes gene_type:complete